MPPRRFDEIGRRILAELQRDGSLTNVDLAARVGLSSSPCLARVRQLEKDGVITGTVALVSPEALGLPINSSCRSRSTGRSNPPSTSSRPGCVPSRR